MSTGAEPDRRFPVILLSVGGFSLGRYALGREGIVLFIGVLLGLAMILVALFMVLSDRSSKRE